MNDILYNHLYAEVGIDVYNYQGPIVMINKRWIVNLAPTENCARTISPEQIYEELDKYEYTK